MLHEAEPQIADPEIRDELAAVRAAMLVFTGRPVEALAIARPILRRRRPEHRAAVRASLAAVTALGFTGGTTEATGLIAQVREPALDSHRRAAIPLRPAARCLLLRPCAGRAAGRGHRRGRAGI